MRRQWHPMAMGSPVTSAFGVFSCSDSAPLSRVRGEQRTGRGSGAIESIRIIVKSHPAVQEKKPSWLIKREDFCSAPNTVGCRLTQVNLILSPLGPAPRGLFSRVWRSLGWLQREPCELEETLAKLSTNPIFCTKGK